MFIHPFMKMNKGAPEICLLIAYMVCILYNPEFLLAELNTEALQGFQRITQLLCKC